MYTNLLDFLLEDQSLFVLKCVSQLWSRSGDRFNVISKITSPSLVQMKDIISFWRILHFSPVFAFFARPLPQLRSLAYPLICNCKTIWIITSITRAGAMFTQKGSRFWINVAVIIIPKSRHCERKDSNCSQLIWIFALPVSIVCSQLSTKLDWEQKDLKFKISYLSGST